ncbi:peptidoglycan editing factor PgeF [Deinococcus yavapaiensis]|nr:peptidoglycan editing factor PgeF [Deinococcus yavapaiensis]
MWLFAPNLNVTHGFSTRHGGVSSGPFASLNLDDREDDAALVTANRERALRALDVDGRIVARLHQVHGTDVRVASPGIQEGDALVTDDPRFVLTIMTADCYPILLVDEAAGVVGAAHAGWRGTLGGVAARTVEAMEGMGARRERIVAAIGPGISAPRYPVGEDLARSFEGAFGEQVVRWRDGVPHLDLARANVSVLEGAGVEAARVWTCERCSTEPDFFSFRRDAGRTGRMWSVITPNPSLLMKEQPVE